MQAQADCSANEVTFLLSSPCRGEDRSEEITAAGANSLAHQAIPEPFASFAARMRTTACHADTYASPGLANAWAQAIITSWQAVYASGQLDPTQPLYILDLAPGTGHLARLLLRALRQRLAEVQTPCPFRGERRDEGAAGASDSNPAQTSTLTPWTIRYLACTTPGSNEPKLDDYHFDTTSWSPLDHHTPPPSNHHAYCWHETSNPAVVLALNYLQTFPGQLRAVHYGSWLEGRVRITSEHDNSCELDYDWQEIASDDSYCSATLRQRYLRNLSNSCVLVPDTGLRALQRIAELTHGRFLWLAVDQGVVDEKQLRFGAMSPPATWSYEAQHIPVNLHALAYDQSMQGAWNWCAQLHEDGLAVQAIWRHDCVSVTQGDYAKIIEYLNGFHPDDSAQLESLACALATDAAPALHLALLRSAHYDPRVVRAALSTWTETSPDLFGAERNSWGDALARAWPVCPRGEEEAWLRHGIAMLALELGRLDIARTVFEHNANHAGRAYCIAQDGRLDLAMDCLESIRDESADALRAMLKRQLERRDARCWYHPDCSRDGELSLVPIDEYHADALCEQYLDPQIGELARLPELETPEVVRAWIAEQSHETGRATYALMHVDTGLMGVVSMQAHGEDAYFYFWIGSAHQGHGYGRRAAHLLFRQAERSGVRRLFTSAYRSNWRSTEALVAVKFQPLPVTALPPDDDLIFFVRDEGDRRWSAEVLHARLEALLSANDSPIVLATFTHNSEELEYGQR